MILQTENNSCIMTNRFHFAPVSLQMSYLLSWFSRLCDCLMSFTCSPAFVSPAPCYPLFICVFSPCAFCVISSCVISSCVISLCVISLCVISLCVILSSIISSCVISSWVLVVLFLCVSCLSVFLDFCVFVLLDFYLFLPSSCVSGISHLLLLTHL